MKDLTLTFEEIRELAKRSGRNHWERYIANDEEPLIDECLQVRRAWMFFRNPKIFLPEGASRKCAIVVSDRGEVRYTADFYPDMIECHKYLSKMSDHFEDENL
ncbi:hypothetical protein IWQ54_001179 [Labrenzia sp. EL_195]|nr:hypothetical protein [Labrenzia sp. EL_195]